MLLMEHVRPTATAVIDLTDPQRRCSGFPSIATPDLGAGGIRGSPSGLLVLLDGRMSSVSASLNRTKREVAVGDVRTTCRTVPARRYACRPLVGGPCTAARSWAGASAISAIHASRRTGVISPATENSPTGYRRSVMPEPYLASLRPGAPAISKTTPCPRVTLPSGGICT